MTVGVVLLTYASSLESPRHAYAVKTLDSLVRNLCYHEELRWHIADDGSPIEHILELQSLIDAEHISYSDAGRRGYGASYNLASQMLHSDCDHLLMVEDDWELVRALDLEPLVAALQEGLGCIRLGYLGWTQELKGAVAKFAGQSFLLFDKESSEPHVWSGHPRLETRDFQRKVGEWPEGLDPGTTEFLVSQRSESRDGVAWPLDMNINASQQYASCFAHIGAVQARSDQLATA